MDSFLLGNIIHIYNYKKKIISLSDGLDYKFVVHYKKNKSCTLSYLCDLYGSDKGEVSNHGHPYPWDSHTYADCYSRLFSHCRLNIRKVFECGLGTNNPHLISSMGVNGKPGASLRVWRDYFPNAMIFGGDIDKTILFQEERIKTYFIDQLNPKLIKQFWNLTEENDFDLMIDDGLHTFEGGKTLFLNSIQHLSLTGLYIIEDVTVPDLFEYKYFFNQTNYDVDYITMYRPNRELGDNNLIVIRKQEKI